MAGPGGAAAALAVAGLGAAAATARGRTHRVADRIAGLDPVEQAREVVWLLGTREFGWDTETALSFALFRTYASPRISVLLEATGEFTERARKRFDDTELVIAEMGKHGLDSDRGRTALRRMNAMHAAFDIDPYDTLYVLSTFVLEPVRWNRRYGWRPMTDAEQRASLEWYRELGHHMGLRDLPDDLAWWDRMNRAYERDEFRHHPANRAVADASVAMFLDANLPTVLHPLGEVVVRALLDPPLLEAFGYAPAPPAVVAAVDAALRARAGVQRHLLPERRTDFDLTLVHRPTYPDGHRVERLGTFPDAATRRRADALVAELPGPVGGPPPRP